MKNIKYSVFKRKLISGTPKLDYYKEERE